MLWLVCFTDLLCRSRGDWRLTPAQDPQTVRSDPESDNLWVHLKVQPAILTKECGYLSSTVNQITPLPSMLLKQHADWLELFMAWSEPLCLFPI